MIVPDLKTKKSYTLKVKTNSLFCGDFDMIVLGNPIRSFHFPWVNSTARDLELLCSSIGCASRLFFICADDYDVLQPGSFAADDSFAAAYFVADGSFAASAYFAASDSLDAPAFAAA